MRSPSISQTEDDLHELNAGKVGRERWHLLSEKLIHKSQEEQFSLQQATSIHTYRSRASVFLTAFHHPHFQHPSLPLSRSSVTFRQLLPDSAFSHPTAGPESHVAVVQIPNLSPTPDVCQLQLSSASCDPLLGCPRLKEQVEVVVPGCCRGAGREGVTLSSTARPFCRPTAPLSSHKPRRYRPHYAA